MEIQPAQKVAISKNDRVAGICFFKPKASPPAFWHVEALPVDVSVI